MTDFNRMSLRLLPIPLTRWCAIAIATALVSVSCGDRIVGFPDSNDAFVLDTVTQDTIVQDIAPADTTLPDTTPADTTAPLVIATNPAFGVTDVGLNTIVTATFSEPMDAATITDTSFVVKNGEALVPGSVTYTGDTASFTPTSPLAEAVVLTATVHASATDLAGNSLAQDYVWNFTTGVAADTTRPQVSMTIPANNGVDVAVNSSVSVVFSEAMDPTSLNELSFTLNDGTPVAGTVTYTGVTAIFRPTSDLNPNENYTAKIGSTASDLAGNQMAADYTWTFTTGALPDTTRPRVTMTTPTDDSIATPFDAIVVVVFSESMDPATLTSDSFTVQQGGTPVAGIVTHTDLTATFTPTLPLDANTVYSATITTVASDLAGNGLIRNFTWNFSTTLAPDTTRPLVVSTIPETDENDVLLDVKVTALFSEVMHPLTINAATFTLREGAMPVTGAVTQIGNTAVFTPMVMLKPDAQYTATLTSAITDLAGNGLAVDYVWQFTTGIELDTTAPMIIAVNPEDLATNVPVDTSVEAIFDEPMDMTTITTLSFQLFGPGNVEVLGLVINDPLTFASSFIPLTQLEMNSTYVATVAATVTDLSGNPMEELYSWSFTTGAGPGLLGVNLGGLASFGIAAGAGLTNSNSSGITTINGDVALTPTGTCIGDGIPCTLTNPVINGTLYQNDPEGVAVQIKIDLLAAFQDAMGRPPGTIVNDISGMTLAPGVYTSASTMSIAVGGQVILDGQGNSNAVWIFQIGSALTVNNNAQVLLINGARAKNVFWAAGSSTTLGGEVSFQGTVMASESNSVGTDSVVVGRLLCTIGQITLLSNNITLPPL